MKNKSIYIAAAAAAVLATLALFLRTFSASPLPKPNPWMGPVIRDLATGFENYFWVANNPGVGPLITTGANVYRE